MLHAGFAHKRKLVIRNLEKIASLETIASLFAKLGIAEKARAEDIPLEKWLLIAEKTAVHTLE